MIFVKVFLIFKIDSFDDVKKLFQPKGYGDCPIEGQKCKRKRGCKSAVGEDGKYLCWCAPIKGKKKYGECK